MLGVRGPEGTFPAMLSSVIQGPSFAMTDRATRRLRDRLVELRVVGPGASVDLLIEDRGDLLYLIGPRKLAGLS